MAIARDRPYVNGNFLVDLGTGDTETPRGAFTEVVIPDAVVQPIEYRAGNDKTNEPKKLVGSVSYANLILRRGLIGETDLYQWWNQARSGATISLLSEDRTVTVWRWTFTNAWPTRYTTSELSAEGDDIVIEEIEICFERLEVD
jgi:phage tail-like protein